MTAPPPELWAELLRARDAFGALLRSPPGETADERRRRTDEMDRAEGPLQELERQVNEARGVNRKRGGNGATTTVDAPIFDVNGDPAERRAPIAGAERRAFVGELRAKGRKLQGYSAVFGAEARIGHFTETIAPGAFAASLAERSDILALVDHDPGRVLARTKSGTLRLNEDSHGLAFDLDVPATSHGNDVLALADRGDLGGMSFSFSVKREKWDGERRVLESVNLHEISVVSAWPAYEGTVVQARARPVVHSSVALARRYIESL